jgi:transposase
MNRVHSLLDKYDIGCTCSPIFGKSGMKWLKAIKLGCNDQGSDQQLHTQYRVS